MTKINVIKRDGSKEPLQVEKIQKCIEWAADGLENVSTSQVELTSVVQFYEGITTDEIHETMIKAAADLTSQATPEYSKLAARLRIFQLRKHAYDQFTPPTLLEHIINLTSIGVYDTEILEKFTVEEINKYDSIIKHDRDMDFFYAGIEQFRGKYLVQNRVTGTVYETPQMAYMLIAMCLFQEEDQAIRDTLVARFYEATSIFKISLPTPILGGVRTPTRQFSSCTLIEAGDSLDEINSASNAIVKYVSQRAGIGINAGMIRAIGSEIRGGEASHTGCIPFYKHFQSAVKSCSQGGIRGGAATLFYPLWHLEVESLLPLKNNRGIEENRVRNMDYGVQLNKLMYTRLIAQQNITLFSPHDVPGLYDAFFADQAEFEKLYTQYEADPTIRKKQVSAIQLFSSIATERAQTGRIYIQNVDHSNTHSSFLPELAPIKQSNLCVEITLPTKPLVNINDENGEIALCTLAAFNIGVIDDLEELEELSELIVRALDNLLDYQDYPVNAAYTSTMNRRPLGVGITNYAYFLAKRGVKFSDEAAKDLTHTMMEAVQFYLLKASNKLAVEKGTCLKFNETKYSKGILPIDTYKRDLDIICNTKVQLDWEGLRKDIIKNGLRNSTLTALMPCESSSQASNSTNGIEPPRGPVSIKQSKHGTFAQTVPGINEVEYEYLWDIKDSKVSITLAAIMQKFVDQSISTNTNYDPSNYPNEKVSAMLIIEDLIYAYKLGIKTLYYHNTRDGSSEEDMDDNCGSGACKL